MSFSVVMRYTVMCAAGAVMIAGILLMVGLLDLRNFPSDYRVIIGALIFLYGCYRFVISYFRKPQRLQ
jgi:hypothetical protein